MTIVPWQRDCFVQNNRAHCHSQGAALPHPLTNHPNPSVPHVILHNQNKIDVRYLKSVECASKELLWIKALSSKEGNTFKCIHFGRSSDPESLTRVKIQLTYVKELLGIWTHKFQVTSMNFFNLIVTSRMFVLVETQNCSSCWENHPHNAAQCR